MRDIGKSRRKEKKPTRNGLQISLEVPESFDYGNTVPRLHAVSVESHAPKDAEMAMLEDLSSDSEKSIVLKDGEFRRATSWLAKPFMQPPTNQRDDVLPRIERLWTGRMDPFVQYPIVRVFQ